MWPPSPWRVNPAGRGPLLFRSAIIGLCLISGAGEALAMAEPEPYDVRPENRVWLDGAPVGAPPAHLPSLALPGPSRQASPASSGAGRGIYREIYPDRWIVRLEPGVEATLLESRLGARLLRRVETRRPWFLIQAPESARSGLGRERFAEALAAHPLIAEAMPDGIPNIEPMAPPSDPLLPQQWHLENTGQSGGTPGADARVRAAWETHGVAGRGVTIAVVDDGVETDHPDLRARYRADIDYDYNFQDGDPNPMNDALSPGIDPHGTSVAGVAASDADGVSCGVGAAYQAEITGRRILGFGPGSGFSWSYVASAFTDHLSQIEVYNNSWGYSPSGTLIPIAGVVEDAIATVTAQGRGGLGSIVLFAGGNGFNYPELSQYDGHNSDRRTISVAAMTDDGGASYYSERGANLLVTAPSNHFGSAITTSDLTGSNGYNQTGNGSNPDDLGCTNRFGGTSSATPLVSGIVALMLEANPDLTWRDVQHILARSARKTDSDNFWWFTNGAGIQHNMNYGFGAVDAEKAVRFSKGWTNVPPEVVTSPRAFDFPQPLLIEDATPEGDGPWATSSIEVTAAQLVEAVEVTIQIDHEDGNDLLMYLQSPSGYYSRVLEPTNQSIPIVGTYKILLRDLLGENAQGTWTLWVRDVVDSGLTGTLNGWGMDIYGTAENAIPYVGIRPGAGYARSEATSPLFAEVVALANNVDSYSWGSDCPDPGDLLDFDFSDGVPEGYKFSYYPHVRVDGNGQFEEAGGPLAIWRAPRSHDTDGPLAIENGVIVSGDGDSPMIVDCNLTLEVSASGLSQRVSASGSRRIDLLPEEATPQGETPGGVITSLLPVAGVSVPPGSEPGRRMDGFVAFQAIGDKTLYNCRVEHEGGAAVDDYFYRYSYWDGYEQVGDLNQPFVVHPGFPSFAIYGVHARKNSPMEELRWRFLCDGAESIIIPEINTLLLSAAEGTPLRGLAAVDPPHPNYWVELLSENNGVVRLATAVGAVTGSGPVTVELSERMERSRPALPVSITGCLVPEGSGSCRPNQAGPIAFAIAEDDPDTRFVFEGARSLIFEIALDPGAEIAPNAATNRLYMVARDGNGTVIAATSIAVTTEDIPGGGYGN